MKLSYSQTFSASVTWALSSAPRSQGFRRISFGFMLLRLFVAVFNRDEHSVVSLRQFVGPHCEGCTVEACSCGYKWEVGSSLLAAMRKLQPSQSLRNPLHPRALEYGTGPTLGVCIGPRPQSEGPNIAAAYEVLVEALAA